MSKKSMKNAIKAGLGISAAMLASKLMGEGKASGTSSGTMDGTEGTFNPKRSLTTRAKNFSADAIDAAAKVAREAKDFVSKKYVMKGENPTNVLSGTGTDSYNMQAGAKKGRMMKAKAGGSVHVKTKLGYSKATKIY